MPKIPVRKITSQTDPTSGRFKIRQVEKILDGKDMIQHTHRHDFYFILALEKGGGVHEIDFVKYPVSDQSIFILRPGQVHAIELKAGAAGFLMEFDTNFYQPGENVKAQRLIRSGHRNFCEIRNNKFQKLLSPLAFMFDEFSAKQEGYTEAIKANMDIFFIEYLRQSLNPDAGSATSNSYSQQRLEEFIEQLGSNITSLKQVSQYADLLNLSIFQLNGITKSTVGKSASELINEHVILEAKRYLLATSDQVKDIADHLGYEDISYFIRFFKKHTGVTPEVFRKNFK